MMTMIEITTESQEPSHGSVLLTQGPTGTAFQRFFSDGLYHGTNGKVLTYAELLEQNRGTQRLLLIHDAAPFDDSEPTPIYVDGAVPESDRGDR